MRIPRPLFTLLPLLLAGFACSGRTAGTNTMYPRRIVPTPEGGGSVLPLITRNEAESDLSLQTPKIGLSYDERVEQVLTTNLDADDTNEQLIVVKGADGEAASLKLVIADFDAAQNRYVRSWDTEIGALDDRTVRIAVKDVMGNHALQIVLSGTTRSNAAVLGVWKIASQASGRLSYAPIFMRESDLSVEIAESDRGVGYSEGYSNGASFPIVVFSRVPGSSDVTSIIRDTYMFSFAAQAYLLQRHETVKVQKAATDRLSDLLQSGSPELLKQYLQGIWYKDDGAGKADQKILTVSTETGEIAFYSKDVQEVYNWKYSRRSLFNTLHIYTESALLKSVQPNITAVLDSPTELSIEITEYSTMEQWLNEEWGGKYVRRTETAAADGGRTRTTSWLLRGEYVSQTGVRAAFEYPSFTWREGVVPAEGGFCVTRVDDGGTARYLLSLKIIADQGLTVTDKFYILELTPPPTGNDPASAFILKPAQTSVYGILALKGQPLVFTRQAR
ncbi:MAG: pallilysin-related adhesin [Spirochaetales bacterium]|nr:pallilysin-related adhesin [Spirochaetales bacterium]